MTSHGTSSSLSSMMAAAAAASSSSSSSSKSRSASSSTSRSAGAGASGGGWVKSKDPRTGRIFYANHLTRTTQWDPPPGFVDPDHGVDSGGDPYAASESARPTELSRSSTAPSSQRSDSHQAAAHRQDSIVPSTSATTPNTRLSRSATTSGLSTPGKQPQLQAQQQEPQLPSNWEVMRDKATGRPFYVDHVRKITTWERPVVDTGGGQGGGDRFGGGGGLSRNTGGGGGGGGGGTMTGFGYIPETSSSSAAGNGTHHGGTKGNSDKAWDDVIGGGASSIVPPYRSMGGTTTGYGASDMTAQQQRHHHNDHQPTLLPPASVSTEPFSVVQIHDSLRPACPSCQVYFSLPLKRRHHCRLCGDVFCDACSNRRCLLPLDGPQYEKPVRVCDACCKDVERSEYFGIRRYLASLQLYDPRQKGLADDNRRVSGLSGGTDSTAADGNKDGGEDEGDITARVVTSALASLASDLDAILLDPTSPDGTGKLSTVPPSVLVAAVSRHLSTSSMTEEGDDRRRHAARALSSMLAIGSVTGNDEYAHATYGCRNGQALDDLLAILEENGTGPSVVASREQAARAVFYLTEPTLVDSILRGEGGTTTGAEASSETLERRRGSSVASLVEEAVDDAKGGGGSADDEVDKLEALDVHRTLRNMLDHATDATSPSLQRWAAASLRHLVAEDRRRACRGGGGGDGGGGGGSSSGGRYESFTTELVSSGGVFILCSLMDADDGDTRAHATAALQSVVETARAVDDASSSSSSAADASSSSDAPLVRSIVSGGGCGPSLARLLLSSDDAVAGMGCTFASCLVSPCFADPRGSGRVLQRVASTVGGEPSSSSSDSGGDDNDGLGAYRDAALELAGDGGCLPALVQLLRGGSYAAASPSERPMDVRLAAMEALAGVALAIAGCVVPQGDATTMAGGDEENLDGGAATTTTTTTTSSWVERVRRAAMRLEEAGAADAARAVLASTSSMSLVSSRDTPASRLREAASLVLGASVALSSAATAAEVTSQQRGTVSALLGTAGEEGAADRSSALRGDWSPPALAPLEAVAAILLQAWKRSQLSRGRAGDEADGGTKTEPPPAMVAMNGVLDVLLEAIDAGAVPLASRVLKSKIEFHDGDRAVGGLRMKVACCYMLSALFGIARDDGTSIGATRLYDALEDHAGAQTSLSWGHSNGGGRNAGAQSLVSLTIALLQSTASHAQHYIMGDAEGGAVLPLVDLVESALLAVGSMCGAAVGCFTARGSNGESSDDAVQVVLSSDDFGVASEDKFNSFRKTACMEACSVLTSDLGTPFLPSVLVGGFGEGCVLPALRLALSIVQNGPIELHPKLARSGILIPCSDILKQSLAAGERYTFSASLGLFRFCGPYATASSVEDGGVDSVKEAIRAVAALLDVEEEDGDETHVVMLRSLKVECILTLETLTSNASLWTSIATLALPAISKYLLNNSDWDENDISRSAVLCIALRTVQRIITLPSHAVEASRAGIGTSLAWIICGRKDVDDIEKRQRDGGRKKNVGHKQDQPENVQYLALEVLHTLASQSVVRRGDGQNSFGLFRCGALRATCFALGLAAHESEDAPQQSGLNGSAQRTTQLGLETLILFLSDLDPAASIRPDLQQSLMKCFVEEVARQSRFIRSLCATMLSAQRAFDSILSKTQNNNESVPKKEGNATGPEESFTFVSLYGPPLALSEGPCAGFPKAQQAALSALFSITAHCSSVATTFSDSFWDTFLVREDRKLVQEETKQLSALAACAVFLNILSDEEEGPCVPRNPQSKEHYLKVSLPLVRKRLLDGLQSFLVGRLAGVSPDATATRGPIHSLIFRTNIPKTCITLLNSSQHFDVAFHIFHEICSKFTDDDLLPLMVQEKVTLLGLLSALNNSATTNGAGQRLMRFTVAEVLWKLAARGDFRDAVERFDLRGRAIVSLSSAILTDDHSKEGEFGADADDDQETIAIYSLKSFVAMLSVPVSSGASDGLTTLQMTPTEAKTIASMVGKKISNLVLGRFFRHASSDATNSTQNGTASNLHTVTNSPEAKLLCALASSKEALPTLCSSGGLEAISLVAAEGEFSAIKAIKEACTGDPSAVLDVDAHISIMDALASPDLSLSPSSLRAAGACCLEILVILSQNTDQGKVSISTTCYEKCATCISSASHIVIAAGKISKKSDTPVKIDNVNIEVDEGNQDRQDVPVTAEDDAHSNTPEENQSVFPLTDEDSSLEVAAFSFLTEFLTVKPIRDILMSDADVLLATTKLSTCSQLPELQYAAVRFLESIAHFAENGIINTAPCSASSVASALCSVVKSINTLNKHYGANNAAVIAAAAAGIECVFSFISPDSKREAIMDLSRHFIVIVDSVSRTSGVIMVQKEQFSLVACNITMVFVLALGCEPIYNTLLEPQIVAAMIRFTTLIAEDLYRERRARITDEGREYWDAALTHCLQCMSNLTSSATFKEKVCCSLEEISADAEKLDGLDAFRNSLVLVTEQTGNGASSVAARRILRCLAKG